MYLKQVKIFMHTTFQPRRLSAFLGSVFVRMQIELVQDCSLLNWLFSEKSSIMSIEVKKPQGANWSLIFDALFCRAI
jgi:hypothetical protein